MNGMQEEIDKLKLNIGEMKNNELEDRELLNEIHEFNRKVSLRIFLLISRTLDESDK